MSDPRGAAPTRIFLTGFMGTGKTEVGRRIAARLGWTFVDTDAEVERSAAATVTEIFDRLGEPAFRRLEAEALGRACALDRAVVATGGGIVKDPANRAAMRRAGAVVCLRARVDAVLELVGSAADRPLLAGEDRRARIEALLSERRAAYEDADGAVDTTALSADEAADLVRAAAGLRSALPFPADRR